MTGPNPRATNAPTWAAEGSRARVYRAEGVPGGPVYAVKVARSTSPLDRTRLLGEAAILRAVRSARIVRLVEDPGDGRRLVLEWVEGVPLATYLRRSQVLPLCHVLRFAGDLAAGLQDLHAAGLCHGDLRPENVICGRDGPAPRLTLIDPDPFGHDRRDDLRAAGRLLSMLLGDPPPAGRHWRELALLAKEMASDRPLPARRLVRSVEAVARKAGAR